MSWQNKLKTKFFQARTNIDVALNDLDDKFENIITIFDDSYRLNQQKSMMKTTKAELVCEAEEEEERQGLIIGGICLGFSAVGFYFHVFGMLAAGPLIFLYLPIFKEAYNSIINKHKIDRHALYSGIALGCLVTQQYFAAALGMCIYHLCEKLTRKVKSNTQGQLTDIFQNKADYAWIQKDNIEIKVQIAKIERDDIVVVNAGESILIDGVVVDGGAMVDQQVLTGESYPIEKQKGDSVLASTLLLSGKIYIRVEKTGAETAVSQISKILSNSSSFTKELQLQGDKQTDRAAFPLIATSFVAAPFVGFPNALGILYSPVGFNSRLLSPICLLNFLNIASNENILIKDGRSLEILSQVDTVVFDKTGTLTLEDFQITRIISLGKYDENKILYYAGSLENRQTHPIAKTILRKARQHGVFFDEVKDPNYKLGYGISGKVAGDYIQLGSLRFLKEEKIDISSLGKNQVFEGSPVFLAKNGVLIAVFELQAIVRPEISSILRYFEKNNVDTCILSGDQEEPTKTLAKKLQIKNYLAEVLPQEKAKYVENLQKKGKFVCFIGDGINDAIVLKKANVSISLNGASSAALDSAQIILLDKNLSKIPKLFDIAKEYKSVVNQNSFITNVAGVACVASIFVLSTGIITSILLAEGSLLLGLGNSIRPNIQNASNRSNFKD